MLSRSRDRQRVTVSSSLTFPIIQIRSTETLPKQSYLVRTIFTFEPLSERFSFGIQRLI